MKKGRFTFSCHEWQIMSPTTLQYSPLQPSTDQHSPVQPSSAHFSQLQPSTAKYSPLQPTTAHFSPVQQSKAKYSPLQPTTAQYSLCLEFFYRFLLGLSRIKSSHFEGENWPHRICICFIATFFGTTCGQVINQVIPSFLIP